jgi:hypothetical protein
LTQLLDVVPRRITRSPEFWLRLVKSLIKAS